MSAATPQNDRWTSDGQYFEYSKAANPIRAGLIAKVPAADFPHTLHETGPTRVISFDLSEQLGCEGPATSPALCSNFIRIAPGERIRTSPNATSELYYVIRGRGSTNLGGEQLAWSEGDFFTLPARCAAVHHADEDAAFFWIHDEPLLRYLGVEATAPRFKPTLYPAKSVRMELDKVTQDPESAKRSRVSVLLANTAFPQTRTVTHIIWAMFGVLPAGAVQPAHTHESVGLDFIVDCKPGCYTMIGERVDDEGNIAGGKRADWKPGSAFVTPAGLWHSHHNTSGEPAHFMPIEDAGLHNYLRTFHIHFVHRDPKVYFSHKG